MFKVGMAEIFHLFFFARISQSLEVILIPACHFLLMMANMWLPKHVNVHAHAFYYVYVKAIMYWASRDDCTAISRLLKTPGENGKRGSK